MPLVVAGGANPEAEKLTSIMSTVKRGGPSRVRDAAPPTT